MCRPPTAMYQLWAGSGHVLRVRVDDAGERVAVVARRQFAGHDLVEEGHDVGVVGAVGVDLRLAAAQRAVGVDDAARVGQAEVGAVVPAGLGQQVVGDVAEQDYGAGLQLAAGEGVRQRDVGAADGDLHLADLAAILVVGQVEGRAGVGEGLLLRGVRLDERFGKAGTELGVVGLDPDGHRVACLAHLSSV